MVHLFNNLRHFILLFSFLGISNYANTKNFLIFSLPEV